jgi:hypothetical protein
MSDARLGVCGVLVAMLAAGGGGMRAWGVTVGCVGDCNGDGVVRIDEVITGVILGLGGAAIDVCPAIDCDSPPGIFVNCAVQAVNNALNGCPAAPTPTPAAPQLALEVEAVPRVAEVLIVARLTHSGGALVSYRDGCTARCRPQFYEPISFELRGPDGVEVIIDYPCGGALLCPEGRRGFSPGQALEQTLSITGVAWEQQKTDPPNECRGCREVALPAGRYAATASFVYAIGDGWSDAVEQRITRRVEFEWPPGAVSSSDANAP